MIELRSVSKSYYRRKAVDKVSLTTRKGEILGIFGPNGSGKSTIIKMILNIIVPNSGEILFNGKPLCEADKDRFGYLPEERGLYRKLRINEMLLYFASLKSADPNVVEKSLDDWLSRFHLSEWKTSKPDTLSKGNVQKVQFIAAVLHDPEYLFLDEPFSGLDQANIDELHEVLIDLAAKGKTILFSTHNMDVAEKVCTRILILDKGHEVMSGSVAEIKAHYGKKTVIVEYDGTIDYSSISTVVRNVTRFPRWMEMDLAEGEKPQTLLAILLGQVSLRKFEVVTPSLQKIFASLAGTEGEYHD